MSVPRARLLGALLGAVAVAAALPAAAVAAELVVVPLELAAEQVASLRQLAAAWERETGNQLLWADVALAAEEEQLDEAGQAAAIADVYLAETALVAKLAAAGAVAPLEPPVPGLAPLYAGMVARPDGSWLGAPLAERPPLLHYDAKLLARSGATELPAAASWDEIFALAAAAADPVGEVHGLCASGWRHATLLRALLAEAGASWLGPQDLPYAGSTWENQAQRYARELARVGPPNAASLDAIELSALLAQGRCALWLLPPGASDAAPALAVPGASALVSTSLVLAAVAAASEQAPLAASFARWLAAARLGLLPGPAEPAIQATLAQPGRAELPAGGGWAAHDAAGEEALRRLVDGLVPAATALSEARAASVAPDS